MQKEKEMQRGLKNRHLQMIALGGAIGTGLFYGSAATIKLAGPAVMISYLVGGIVVFLIMRMLGEMAVEEPVSGSFSRYAAKYWAEFPGFFSGWNYWFNYVIVSMAELSVVGIYMNYWLPDLPQWVSALVTLAVITMLNIATVRAYGEMEFWMAIVKVVAILLMIVLGLWLLLQEPEPFPANFGNLWLHGGFFPNGIWGMLLSITVVMFSFGGIELIGITAGEAADPARSIPRAINQVIWRILIFYVGAMAVLMALWPWDEVGMGASPFVQIFSNVGIPSAAHILNFVVLTAAISVYNSAIYSNSRMLYGLAAGGDAPKIFARLSRRGVPVAGILASSGVTLIAVLLNYLFPDRVFMLFLAIAMASVIISWGTIVITHLKFRRFYQKTGRKASFRAPLFPLANYLCLAFLVMMYLLMTQMPAMQIAVAALPVWLFVLWLGYRRKKRRKS